eukprot:1160905-Pelagomonas_calceolata.AAC.1
MQSTSKRSLLPLSGTFPVRINAQHIYPVRPMQCLSAWLTTIILLYKLHAHPATEFLEYLKPGVGHHLKMLFAPPAESVDAPLSPEEASFVKDMGDVLSSALQADQEKLQELVAQRSCILTICLLSNVDVTVIRLANLDYSSRKYILLQGCKSFSRAPGLYREPKGGSILIVMACKTRSCMDVNDAA